MIPLLLVAALQAAPSSAAVAYTLRLPEAGGSRVEVSIRLPVAAAGPRTLVMPRAVPMGYANVPYDRFVEDVRAEDARGRSVRVRRQEGPRWSLGEADDTVMRVVYRVDVARMERTILGASDASKARPGYLGLLGYSVFGYVEGLEERAVRLRVEGPPAWPVFSTLDPGPPRAGPLDVTAARFYDLADSQVLMGPELRVARLSAPIPLFLAVYAEAPVDLELVGSLAEEAVRRVVAYFGSAPLPHYTVVQEYLRPLTPEHEYGFSMEHMESGTFFLGVERAPGPATPAQERERTLLNFVHHVAHSWIPKRSYGEGYFPFQWELAPLIETIWLSEGWIRYAAIDMTADALPADAGVRYRRGVLDGFRRDLQGMPPFLKRLSLVELSRVGSVAYSADFRVGRSLYMRGALLAAELDERIREATQGRRRFRDVLRYLVSWSQRQGRAFRTDELPGLVRQATGVDVAEVFRRHLAPPSGA